MKLLPLDRPELFELVSGWLARKENHQWLDFASGGQRFTPAMVRIMAQRETHFMRAYTSDRNDAPVGIVGLTNVDRVFKTGRFWGISGEKSFRNRGYSTLACSRFLTLVFRDLGLHAVNTWVVEHNPSRRIIERLGFRFIGRMRQCHYIDGRLYDRLLFDLLAAEHRELDEERWHRTQGAQRRAAYAERPAHAG